MLFQILRTVGFLEDRAEKAQKVAERERFENLIDPDVPLSVRYTCRS